MVPGRQKIGDVGQKEMTWEHHIWQGQIDGTEIVSMVPAEYNKINPRNDQSMHCRSQWVKEPPNEELKSSVGIKCLPVDLYRDVSQGYS